MCHEAWQNKNKSKSFLKLKKKKAKWAADAIGNEKHPLVLWHVYVLGSVLPLSSSPGMVKGAHDVPAEPRGR